MKNQTDLHMHSSYSNDADFTPTELVHKCKAAGIKTMSITDHNSVKGTAEGKKVAAELGIEYISGIEINTIFNGTELHLLGYGIDENNPDFAKLDEHIFSQELNASRERLELTKKLGFEIHESELNAIADIKNGGVWIGETFAEVLLAKTEYIDHPLLQPYRIGGERGDNPFVNFFWDYFAQGKPCYIEMDFPSLGEAIAMIKNNGGKVVLAHPANNLKGQFELFDEIAKAGIDGVEAFCSYHDEKTAKYFYEKALEFGLMITCGSDYHGKTKPAVRIGEVEFLDCVSHHHMLKSLLQGKDILC